jgi:hypothetical protein
MCAEPFTRGERFGAEGFGVVGSGEGGIRTHEAVNPPTRFPSELLKPLGHLSKCVDPEG